jgi:hypothetical protein
MNPRALDEAVGKRLRDALFDTSLAGIKATGDVYPLGAFLLIGATLDMAAGLMHAPERDNDGKQSLRYEAFINRFFDERYRTLGTGQRMWHGLRCRPLHNFSAQGLLLADSQATVGLHLHVHDGNVVLHWPEFLGDYETALNRYWSDLGVDSALQQNAERRCQQHPPITITRFPVGGASFPISFPLTFGGVASAYGGPPVEPRG